MAKLYQTLLWKSLMGILFNFVLSNTLHTRNTHVLQLSADHQGDCFTSCKNTIISTFIHFRSSQTVLVTFPYLPWYWPWVHVNDNVQPEGVKLSPLCPGKIGFLLLVPLQTHACTCRLRVKCRLVAKCRMRTADLGWNSNVILIRKYNSLCLDGEINIMCFCATALWKRLRSSRLKLST